MKRLLPEGTPIYEDCEHSVLKWPQSLRAIEFDIWIPSMQLALEYQGEQHYHDNYSAFGSSGEASLYQERDLEKKRLSREAGIVLVDVPYWWDYRKSTLTATIAKYRPALREQYFPNEEIGIPIPDERKKNKVLVDS